MRIAINASFVRKQNTGIGQVSVNFLKKLIEISKKVNHQNDDEFFIYLEEDVDLDFPENFQKIILKPAYKRDDLIRKIWWEKFSLPRRVKKDGCEVLLSLYQCPTMLRAKRKTKHIMLVHDLIPKFFPGYLNNRRKKIYQKLTERAILRADKIVAVSHRTEKDLVQQLGVRPEKISVSYIDVDEIYKQEIGKEQHSNVLKKYNLEEGYIYSGGGLEVRKNISAVLKAYKWLLDTYGNATWLPKLVIYGKLMPQLVPLVTDAEQLVRELELEEYVKLLGSVPQEDLPALHHAAKIFVYPSHYEGFGMPILEAMNQGTPVVTAKTSSLPEIGSDAVLYCNPDDPTELARIIKKVLTDDKLQTALSLKGKERAGHFDMNIFVKKILNLFHE